MKHRMAKTASEYAMIKKLTQKHHNILRKKEIILKYHVRSGVAAFGTFVIMIVFGMICSFLDTLFFLLGPREEGVLVGFSSQGLFYLSIFVVLELYLLLRFIYHLIKMKRFLILITNERLIVKKSNIYSSFVYTNIVSVSVLPSWFGSIFGYGTLEIRTANGISSVFYQIRHVRSLMEVVNKLISLNYATAEEK